MNFLSALKRTAILTLAVSSVLVISSTSASAAPPPPDHAVTPMTCIYQYNENDLYVEEGWVGAAVDYENGVFLGCGDERSGVIHIAHPNSSGNTHPVYERDQDDFLRCFSNLAHRGSKEPDKNFPDTRTRYKFTFYIETSIGTVPQMAQMVVDNAGGFVYTIWTPEHNSYPRGNNWYGCAGPIA